MAGYPLGVQIQSRWFLLDDRNPQTNVDEVLRPRNRC